ncbi:MAG: hypothetical protein HFI38_00765 [Lachnospiraceae bacterium]|jgi:hypothetical protein|nr:hypothetical protein [Lachnospiraceae bacterium]
MKKLDEMERNIQLRAKEKSYHVVLLVLSFWTFFHCWQTLQNGEPYRPLPGLLVCAAAAVQGFSEMAMKRRMTAGEEEYREPNIPFWTALAAAMVSLVFMAAGTYWILVKA